MQSLIDLTNDKFGGGDYDKDEARILLIFSASKDLTGAGYLTFGAKKSFNFLRHAFIQASILQHFDLERYIQIETNVSGYVIGRILSQLILDDLGQ